MEWCCSGRIYLQGLRILLARRARPDWTTDMAPPERLGHLSRSQWTIENRLYFVRDTAFAEDASQARTGHGPDNMAALRNLAINTLRTGHRNIAVGLRHASYEPSPAGLTSWGERISSGQRIACRTIASLPLQRQRDLQPLDPPQPPRTAESVESPVLGDEYAAFGERHGGTDRWQHRHRAPCRLNRHPPLRRERGKRFRGEATVSASHGLS